MKVKSIRGSIKYNGTVYLEGEVFDISSEDFGAVQENVEVISSDEQETSDDKTKKNNSGEYEDKKDTLPEAENSEKDKAETEDVSYSRMKKDDLVTIAKKKGIEFTDKTTKDELVSLLENFGK